MEYESAVITGTAVPVTEETEKLAALRTICEKYCPENMDAFEASAARSLPRTAVWRIEIVSITGKRKKYDAEGIIWSIVTYHMEFGIYFDASY